MYDQAEFAQLMLERLQMTEEAFERAKSGQASEDDWQFIRHELGLGRDQNDHCRNQQRR
jgi:hypothetical protein